VRPPQVRNENSSISGCRDDALSIVRNDAAAVPEAGRLAEVRASAVSWLFRRWRLRDRPVRWQSNLS